jgi:hypothetical protein
MVARHFNEISFGENSAPHPHILSNRNPRAAIPKLRNELITVKKKIMVASKRFLHEASCQRSRFYQRNKKRKHSFS